MNQEKVKTHAALDANSRLLKAKKIEKIIRNYSEIKYGQFLEVGCGSGFISHYFSELGFGFEGTYAVDVADERQVFDSFHFFKVEDTKLPFKNNQFDLIVSNHVIEHVGDLNAQNDHLKEIHRVLKPDGILYFSVPNKWQIIEPHYKLPFLSWLNQNTASKYISYFKKGTSYDCQLLSVGSCEELLRNNNFVYNSMTADAIRIYALIEGGMLANFVSKLPSSLLKILNPIIPTLIYVCKKLKPI
jgi:SAM-dependent methyltransferase